MISKIDRRLLWLPGLIDRHFFDEALSSLYCCIVFCFLWVNLIFNIQYLFHFDRHLSAILPSEIPLVISFQYGNLLNFCFVGSHCFRFLWQIVIKFAMLILSCPLQRWKRHEILFASSQPSREHTVFLSDNAVKKPGDKIGINPGDRISISF